MAMAIARGFAPRTAMSLLPLRKTREHCKDSPESELRRAGGVGRVYFNFEMVIIDGDYRQLGAIEF